MAYRTIKVPSVLGSITVTDVVRALRDISRPVERSTGKLLRKAAAKKASAPHSKPVERSTGKLLRKAAAKTASAPHSKPVERSTGKLLRKAAAKKNV